MVFHFITDFKQVSQKIRVDTLRWAAGVECVVGVGGKSVQQEGVVFRRTCLVYREGRFMLFTICTGKSLSEVLIYLSINPQYDNRLSNDLQVQ